MIKKQITVISDFSGGQDTKTPMISMALNKSPNMRNFHCAGVKNRLVKRGGFSKLNLSTVESDGLDVFYPCGYQTYDYPLRYEAANTRISQGFKCKTSGTVTKVRLWLKKVETPAATDTVTLEIQSDSSGVPSGTEVTNGVATAIDISDVITSSYAWVTFTFSTNPTLVAGTQYHLMLEGAFTISTTNYIHWGVDNYDVIYPDGTMSVYDGTTWMTDTLYDACFEVYISDGVAGNDGFATWDFSSKNMLLGVFGTTLYKMDKDSSGNPDGVWDALTGGGTWDAFTKLMLHCDGSDQATTFTDEISHIVTANGDAKLVTAEKKFGTASGIFDGSDDLTVPDSDDWNLESGDFSFDFWSWFDAVGANGSDHTIFYQETDGTNFWDIRWHNIDGGTGYWELRVRVVGVNIIVAQGTFFPTLDTWYHIEISRSGNNFRWFVDGVQVGSTTVDSSSMPDFTGSLYIGSAAGSRYFTGQLD
ncbi:hypothetical protein LCGC14_1044100, partial [marine sediment metagenome]